MNKSKSRLLLIGLTLSLLGCVKIIDPSGGAVLTAGPAGLSLDFGLVNLGASKTLTLVVTNTGQENATGIRVTAVSAPFSLSTVSCVEEVAPGGTCTFEAVFSPVEAITYSLNFILNYNNGVDPITAPIAVTGTGVALEEQSSTQPECNPVICVPNLELPGQQVCSSNPECPAP